MESSVEDAKVVVMPADNAARTLVRTYRDIPPGVVDHVIVVDDLSRDDTVAVAELLELQVVVHRQNLGDGGNQKTCDATALAEGADIVVVLWLARQLGLEVAEVGVAAMERQGSKVQMVADALEGLGGVWTIRRARTAPRRRRGGIGNDPMPGGAGRRRQSAAGGGDRPGRRAARPPGQLTTTIPKGVLAA